jgi:integration host factor subunit beta
VTKNELIKTVQGRFETYPAKDIAFACNSLFDLMTGAMRRGERVEIRGFGVFSVRNRKDKVAKNPQDGSPVKVPAKRVPFFKMALEIKKGLLNHDDV